MVEEKTWVQKRISSRSSDRFGGRSGGFVASVQ